MSDSVEEPVEIVTGSVQTGSDGASGRHLGPVLDPGRSWTTSNPYETGPHGPLFHFSPVHVPDLPPDSPGPPKTQGPPFPGVD